MKQILKINKNKWKNKFLKVFFLLYFIPVQLQSDGYQNDESINGDRILLLEQQITQLNRMVEMLKAQVRTLFSLLNHLAGFESLF